MNKIKIISALLITLCSYNLVANDFYYKSKQEQSTITIYEKLVTDSMVVEEIILDSQDNKRELRFKGLQNKENMNNKYRGNLIVEKANNENMINLLINTEDKNKKIDIFLNTKDYYINFIDVVLKSDYISVLEYMSKGFFEINLNNKNDTAYLLSMLSLENKEKFLKDLISVNSNDVNETLKIFNQEEIIKIDNYKLEIQNVLSFEFSANLKIEKNNILLNNVKIKSNVIESLEALKEIESVFGIQLNKGENYQEIAEIVIKRN